MLLEGAIAAMGKVGLMMNVERKHLDAVSQGAAGAEESHYFSA